MFARQRCLGCPPQGFRISLKVPYYSYHCYYYSYFEARLILFTHYKRYYNCFLYYLAILFISHLIYASSTPYLICITCALPYLYFMYSLFYTAYLLCVVSFYPAAKPFQFLIGQPKNQGKIGSVARIDLNAVLDE